MIIGHKEGCTPVQPCNACEAAGFLRTKLSVKDFQQFVGILEGTGPGLFDSPIEFTEFSNRTGNVLKNENITTYRHLLSLTEAKFLSFPNAGRTTLNEVKEVLIQKGLKFGQLL